MRTGEQVKFIADSIYNKATESLARITEVHQGKVTGYTGEDIDSILGLATTICGIVGDSVALQREGDVGMPKYLTRVTSSDPKSITLTLRSKLNAAYKYRKDFDIAFSSDFITDIGTAFIEALFDMLYIALALDNLNALNAKVAEICAENELPLMFRFVMDDTIKGAVAEITDTCLTLNVNIDMALNSVATLGIMCQDDDEYGETIRTEAANRLVEAMKGYTITPQLLKADNITEISTMTNLPTKSKVTKIIRKAYHRNVKHLDKLKGAGVGYFDEDVQIGDDVVSVFALVARDADGVCSVILHPFDVKGLMNVQYDVLA